MPSKFVTAWKAAGGPETPSIREMGAAYDNLMPLIMAAGPVIGPAGLALAGAITAEDNKLPLSLARLDPPGNIFPTLFVPSMVAAMGQLTAMFLSTFTPPTPAQALAAWNVTPAGTTPGPSSAILATAMSLYMSGAFIGGVGNPTDAPPPPPPPDAPQPLPLLVPSGFTSIFGWYDNTDDQGADLDTNELRFYPHVVPREWTYSDASKQAILAGTSQPQPRDILVYSWQFDDPSGPTNLGSKSITAYGAYSFPEDPNYEPGYTTNDKKGDEVFNFGPSKRFDVDFLFPYTGSFDVTMTVCNASGSMSELRSAYAS